MDEPMAEDDSPGPVASALAMVRLMAGWAATGLSVLNLSMGVDTGPGSTDGPYLIFHAVLLITGLTLLALGMLRKRPGRTAYLAGAAVAGGGFLISTLAHGYPFPLDLGRHVVADLVFWGCAGLFMLIVFTQLRPMPAAEPAEQAHPREQAEPAEQAHPAEQAAPAEQAHPAEQAERAEQAHPAEQAQPTEQAEPAEQAHPAEQAAPAERRATHAEQRAPAPRDENVGGLP